MSIFPKLKLEPIVQELDKTRLDAGFTFVTKDEAAITLVEIEPFAGDGFVDVTGSSSDDWYLDFVYSGAATQTVSLRITTDGAPITETFTLETITKATDSLFSEDSDLLESEDDLLQWLRPGKDSYIDKHRSAQTAILDYLDEQGIWSTDGTRITKEQITSLDDVRRWSKFETLMIIFNGMSNAIDDIFADKAERYAGKRDGARSRAAVRLDLNKDGNTDPNPYDIKSAIVIRR